MSAPLQIEKSTDPLPKIRKGVYKRASHNPNVRVSPNYSIVEEFSQTPCAMSSLEVLQSCRSQSNALLEAIGSLDFTSLMEKFDMFDVKPCLSYNVSFQIEVVHGAKTIGWTIVEESASTCIMAISCWRALGSPKLVPSTSLLTAFDAIYFCPHGILPSRDNFKNPP